MKSLTKHTVYWLTASLSYLLLKDMPLWLLLSIWLPFLWYILKFIDWNIDNQNSDIIE